MKGRNAEHEVVNEDPKGHIVESIHLPKAANYMKDIDTVQIDAAGSERDTLSTKLPWEIEQDTETTDARQGRAVRNLTLAELTIPEPELRRLRILSLHLKQRVKIGRNGVSKDLVRSIHERWRTCEIVKLKCEGPAAGNMKKTLETLEVGVLYSQLLVYLCRGMCIWHMNAYAHFLQSETTNIPSCKMKK
jgi:RNA-binding protein YhbY